MPLFDWDRPDLKDAPFVPHHPDWCSKPENIFSAIQESDRLVHHPYDSYDCVTDFINQAVEDDRGSRNKDLSLPHGSRLTNPAQL